MVVLIPVRPVNWIRPFSYGVLILQAITPLCDNKVWPHETLSSTAAQLSTMVPVEIDTPPIQLGCQHTHNTRYPVYFTTIVRCRLALLKRHSVRQKTITWCNSLPQQDFCGLLFYHNLYMYLVCML